MEKKYQKLYIWSFIIISGVILSLLYTPLGGDLHRSTYNEYQSYNNTGVNFSGGIGNAPKNARSARTQTNNDDAALNLGSGNSMLNSNVVTSTKGNSRIRSNGGGSQVFNSQKTTTNTATNSGGGMIALGGRSSSGGNNSGGGNGGGGMFSPSAAPFDNGGVSQRAPGDPGGSIAIADPGGDGMGNPLPVGDGLGILLIMSIFYSLYLFRKRKYVLLK